MAFIISDIIDAMILDISDAFIGAAIGSQSVVRRGPLQEDPEDNVTSALIYENDPNDINGWCHEIVFEGMELGGSGIYRRRFTVELRIFLTREGYEREDAKDAIDLIHGRTIDALRNSTRILACTDEFGEVVLFCKNGMDKSRMVLRGGPPDSWIGEGKLWFTVYTQLP